MRAPKLKREALTELTPSDMTQIAGANSGLSCLPTLHTCGCGATQTCLCGATNTCGCNLTRTCTCNATNTCTCGSGGSAGCGTQDGGLCA